MAGDRELFMLSNGRCIQKLTKAELAKKRYELCRKIEAGI